MNCHIRKLLTTNLCTLALTLALCCSTIQRVHGASAVDTSYDITDTEQPPFNRSGSSVSLISAGMPDLVGRTSIGSTVSASSSPRAYKLCPDDMTHKDGTGAAAGSTATTDHDRESDSGERVKPTHLDEALRRNEIQEYLECRYGLAPHDAARCIEQIDNLALKLSHKKETMRFSGVQDYYKTLLSGKTFPPFSKEINLKIKDNTIVSLIILKPYCTLKGVVPIVYACDQESLILYALTALLLRKKQVKESEKQIEHLPFCSDPIPDELWGSIEDQTDILFKKRTNHTHSALMRSPRPLTSIEEQPESTHGAMPEIDKVGIQEGEAQADERNKS